MLTPLHPESEPFYARIIRLMSGWGVPFQVGGAYALNHYTGIERPTKDLDLVVKAADIARALELCAEAGYRTELTFPHWLGKVYDGEAFVDMVFRSGNGLTPVDDEWMSHGVPGEVLGLPVRLCPAEEMLCSKAFIMERERFDGADVAHLIKARGERFDWARVLRRFDGHWRVLLAHLVLFGYIYPGERRKIPVGLIGELSRRLGEESMAVAPPNSRICLGPFLSREQYLTDLNDWGYKDARVALGAMSPGDVAQWTDAIGDDR